MDPARYEELMELFDRACDLPREEQEVMVAELREKDPPLADRLAKLLHHDARQTDLLAPAAGPELLATELRQAVALEGPSEPDERRSRIGAEVGGLVVGEHLGAGGTGAVYLARHEVSGVAFAIKFLQAHATADPDNVQRLRREFDAISRLDHPGVLRVISHGDSSHGHYIVMEYVQGGDLRRLIGAERPVILRVLRDVARALAYVHARGVVHRDLKPANVLLTDRMQPKLADFGIAKINDASVIITGSRTVMGSIDYVSPEQLRGKADARSDMFSLGCVIHELWCGELPFSGDNYERLSARLHGRAPSLATRGDAPPSLVAMTDRLLSPNPDDRPGQAADVAEVLDGLL